MYHVPGRRWRGHIDLLYELVNQKGDVALSVRVDGLIARRPSGWSDGASAA